MKKNLFVIFYYPYLFIKFLFRKFINNTQLRVLIFHDIKPEEKTKFLNLINYIRKKWTILSPIDFLEMIEKKNKPKGKFLMISFDDGFKSNESISKLLKKKYNITALFFVITNFIKIKNKNESNRFAREKINNYEENLFNLNEDDINLMINDGHIIGSHTCDHNNLSSLNKKELKIELLNSKKFIEYNYKIICNNFAIPYGNINSYCTKSVSEMKKNYKYIYTGLRGNNNNYHKDLFLKRDSINLNYSILFNSLCIEGFFDWYYFLSNKKTSSIFNTHVK